MESMCVVGLVRGVKCAIRSVGLWILDLWSCVIFELSKFELRALWSFTLPKVIDPNNQSVAISTNLSATFFTFDKFKKAIVQIKVFDSSSKQTLQITLKNRLNLNSTYSMDVYFDCKVAKNFTFDDEFKTKQKSIASKG